MAKPLASVNHIIYVDIRKNFGTSYKLGAYHFSPPLPLLNTARLKL